MTYKGKISKKYKLFIMIPCACECGELINSYDKKGRPRKFKKGHQQRNINHHNWGGGRKKDKRGYWQIWKPDHPYADTKGYIFEHRSIYEHYLKILFDEDIYIPSIYEVHHIKHVTKEYCDNSLMNLELWIKSDHTKIHHPRKDYSDVFCSVCGTTETSKRKNGQPNWYGNEIDGWKCTDCHMKEYNKEIRQPRRKMKREIEISMGIRKLSNKPRDPITGRFIKN